MHTVSHGPRGLELNSFFKIMGIWMGLGMKDDSLALMQLCLILLILHREVRQKRKSLGLKVCLGGKCGIDLHNNSPSTVSVKKKVTWPNCTSNHNESLTEKERIVYHLLIFT